MTSPTGNNASFAPKDSLLLPFCVVPAESARVLGRGSLVDYLGYKGTINTRQRINNIMRFMAYHKIYDDWYRDSRIQKPVFDDAVSVSSTATPLSVATLPYQGINGSSALTYGTSTKFAGRC